MPISNDLQLALTDVTAGYGARRVLAGLTLALRGGETLVVAGANGSGKSTLLRLLCGLQRPSAGQIVYTIAGRCYGPSEARDLVGWVAPDLQLYRELTALENLQFFAQVRGDRRVVLVVPEHDEGAQPRPGRVQHLDQQRDIFHLFADISSDAQHIG